MPIKFPKFSRRKSAGHALDAAYEPANTGSPLRVGFEGDDQLHAGGSPYGGYSGHFYNTNHNTRESGTPTTSASGYSGGGYYGSGSSNRLSSSSTIPSADIPHTPSSTEDQFGSRRFDKAASSGQSNHSSQTPNSPTSLGRRSVGGSYATSPPRKMPLSPTEPPRLETKLDTTSFEDMFASYDPNKQSEGIGTIAPTAPKLATSLLPPVTSENSGSLSPTNTIPTRKPVPFNEAQTPAPPPRSYNPATVAPKVHGIVKEKVQTFNTYSRSLNMYGTDANGGVERWAGRPSEEGLISSHQEEKPPSTSPRQSRNLTHTTQASSNHSRKDSLTAPPRNTRLPKTALGDLKRTSAVIRRPSIPTDDEDANVVMNNIQRPQGSNSVTSPHGPRKITDKLKDRDSGWEEAVASGSSSINSLRDNASSASSKGTAQTSITSPRSPGVSRQNTDENFSTIKVISSHDNSSKTNQTERIGVELRDGSDTESISEAVALAAKFEEETVTPAKEQPKKVMTKAQFERYRQQQDDERRLRGGKGKSDSDSESEEDEYDSDTERNKEVIRQRQKQEAHLAIYRQQMMKITGSSASSEALNGPYSAPMLSLNNSMPHINLTTPEGGSDEDEDVPLGILAAHGFPNKNRPPAKLSHLSTSSQPNLRAIASQQQSIEPGSGRGQLPVFARNLPADPYNFGAGLVEAPTRMSLGLGVGTGSVSGGSVYGGMGGGSGASVYGGHPGGLIGEIALAEEMKAARRGGGRSPGLRPHSSGVRTPVAGGGMLGLGGGAQGMMGMPGMPGMPGMMGANMMNPGMMGMDPAMQMQMQQMQQMMQMQMQWMQQMQTQQQMMQNPGMANPMMMPRPNSIAVSNNLPLPNSPAMRQRTMSMIDPTLGNFVPPPRASTYAPSIAPSMNVPAMGIMAPMMSGVGPQAGYTPSIAPSERSTVGLPSRYRPVSQVGPTGNAGSRTSTMNSSIGHHNWNQPKATGGSALKNTAKVVDDDDDDIAWEELEKKKREKQDGWRKKKDLKSMLSFGSSSTTTTAAAS